MHQTIITKKHCSIKLNTSSSEGTVFKWSNAMSCKYKIKFRLLKDGKIVVESISSLPKELQGALKEGEHVDPVLALHLVFNNIARVEGENGAEIDLAKLIEEMQNSLSSSALLVLQDLMKRGRKVVPGATKNDLVLLGERIVIHVLDEDADIGVEELYNMVDNAIKQGYRFVVAIVDMHGDVTYYEVTKTSFPKIERSGEFI
jgi:tRNA splicing endonuclease